MNIIKQADIMLMVIDLNEDPVDQMKMTLELLERFRILPAGRPA